MRVTLAVPNPVMVAEVPVMTSLAPGVNVLAPPMVNVPPDATPKFPLELTVENNDVVKL